MCLVALMGSAAAAWKVFGQYPSLLYPCLKILANLRCSKLVFEFPFQKLI
jgi:hypothetical protein